MVDAFVICIDGDTIIRAYGKDQSCKSFIWLQLWTEKMKMNISLQLQLQAMYNQEVPTEL